MSRLDQTYSYTNILTEAVESAKMCDALTKENLRRHDGLCRALVHLASERMRTERWSQKVARERESLREGDLQRCRALGLPDPPPADSGPVLGAEYGGYCKSPFLIISIASRGQRQHSAEVQNARHILHYQA